MARDARQPATFMLAVRPERVFATVVARRTDVVNRFGLLFTEPDQRELAGIFDVLTARPMAGLAALLGRRRPIVGLNSVPAGLVALPLVVVARDARGLADQGDGALCRSLGSSHGRS